MAAKVKKAPKAKKVEISAGDARGIVKSKYIYDVQEGSTAGGRKAKDNGDAVAEAMRGLGRAEVVQLASDNDVDLAKHKDKNDGHLRMLAGNMLRGLYRRNGRIKVKGRWVNNPGYTAPEKKEKEAA